MTKKVCMYCGRVVGTTLREAGGPSFLVARRNTLGQLVCPYCYRPQPRLGPGITQEHGRDVTTAWEKQRDRKMLKKRRGFAKLG